MLMLEAPLRDGDWMMRAFERQQPGTSSQKPRTGSPVSNVEMRLSHRARPTNSTRGSPGDAGPRRYGGSSARTSREVPRWRRAGPRGPRRSPGTQARRHHPRAWAPRSRKDDVGVAPARGAEVAQVPAVVVRTRHFRALAAPVPRHAGEPRAVGEPVVERAGKPRTASFRVPAPFHVVDKIPAASVGASLGLDWWP